MMQAFRVAMVGVLLTTSYTAAGQGASAPRTPRASAPSADTGTLLLLLGTGGGPGGRLERSGIASLVTVKGAHYLIDAGEGLVKQLARARVKEVSVPAVFLTHLHDDHTAGLSALMTFAYTLRGRKMELIGPPGTKQLVDGTIASFEPNAQIRTAENRLPLPPSDVFAAREVEPGMVYSDENVRVFAAENTHYHLRGGVPTHPVASRNRSYSLRFETPDRVIVFTGDTGPSSAVEKLATGADILVSEMITESDVLTLPEQVRKVVPQGHLTPTQVGQLAAAAKVKTVVLSHIGVVQPSDIAEIKRYFTGKVVAGEDLNRF